MGAAFFYTKRKRFPKSLTFTFLQSIMNTENDFRKERFMSSIRDVAKHAGVAISTVSKVLNNYPNVSSETKQKVNDAIAELNFVPNAVAAALSSKSSKRVALLMNQSIQQAIDEIDMQYLSGAILKAKELGLDVVTLFFSMLKDKSIEEVITYLKSQSIEGLVIFGLSKDETMILELVKREEFKTVLIDAPLVGENTSCVWVDQQKAQYDVIKELLRLNPSKKILYLAGKENSFVMEGRLRGVTEICTEKKCRLTVKRADFSEKKARETVMKFAKNQELIACASDLMAIGAMRALTEMDIFRPVCGFDGITLMGYAGKQMTTVRQNFKNIAATAVSELLNLLNGEAGREVIMPHEVVRIEYLDVIS